MACEKERALVDSLIQQHAEAQEDCNQGIHPQCARAAVLARQLVRAREELQSCLSAPPPPAASASTTPASTTTPSATTGGMRERTGASR
jgi:hypothetical protein